MKEKEEMLKSIGIQNESFFLFTVNELIHKQILEKPLDGNHGEIHPKGSDFVSSGIPFIMASDIKNGIIDFRQCKFIHKTQADSLRKGFSKNGDILLTHKATIGQTAIVKYEKTEYIMLTPQVTYYRVRDKQALSNRYLYYYFKSSYFQKVLNLWASSGSTRSYIGITEQTKLPIILAPLPIQRKIAAVLSAYDDLIDSNNRRIAILEKMAEELYREWFVRLRFPGHEKVKVVKGVPEGWEVKTVASLGNVITGKTPSTSNSSFYTGEYPFIKTPDMHNTMFLNHTEETLSEAGFNSQKSQIIPERSICVSCIGTGGVVSITTKISQTNQQINTVVLNDSRFLEWSFFSLKSLEELIKLFGYTGSTMTNLSKGKFKKLKILMPEKDIIYNFNKYTRDIFDKIERLGLLNTKLSTIRNSVLSRLMSGKINLENLDIQYPESMQEEMSNA